MIKLTISIWTTNDGKNLTTYALEGNTYPFKEKIKQLGFRWCIPADVVAALGFEAANDPMFARNKQWNVTYETGVDKSEWIDTVCSALDAQVVATDETDKNIDVNGYDVDIDDEKIIIKAPTRSNDYIKTSPTKVYISTIVDEAYELLAHSEDYLKSCWGCWGFIAKDAIEVVLYRDKGFNEKLSKHIADIASKNDRIKDEIQYMAERDFTDMYR